MQNELLKILQTYPDYAITGAIEHNMDWGRLVDIRVMHHIKTIKLIFGYEF